MANKKGPWAFKVGKFEYTTKAEVLDLVQQTIDLATSYVTGTHISGYNIELKKLDAKNIRSGKQAEKLINELLKLDFKKIKLSSTGLISDIDIDTNLITITRMNRYRTKTGKIIYYDAASFTAHEYMELLKQQRMTNLVRQQYNLSTYQDINFKKGTKYEEAIHTIARAGSEEAIAARALGDVQGVLTSLSSALNDSDLDYSGIDKMVATALIGKINELGVIDSYARLRYAMDLVGQNKFYDVYGSDKETIRDTGLIDALADAFDITFSIDDVDTTNLDEEDIKILREKSDNGTLKYSDILIPNGADIKW